MKKILTAIFLLMLSHNTIYSQGTQKKVRSMTPEELAAYNAKFAPMQAKEDSASEAQLTYEIKKAKFVFEGTVIAFKSYQGGSGNDFTYTAQTIKIHKIFKGKLACGIIKVISNGGYKPNKFGRLEHMEGIGLMPKGTSGIFLCGENTLPDSPISIITDNSIVLQSNNLIKYDYEPGTFESLVFHSYQQIYNRINKEKGIQLIKCDSMDFQKQRDSIYSEANKWHKVRHDYEKDSTKAIPKQNNIKSKGPNNQTGFFLTSPSPSLSSLAPSNSSPDAGVRYKLENTSYDSLNKSLDFDIYIQKQSDEDTFALYPFKKFFYANVKILA